MISVVIPVYNKERYVARAIRSVLEQSHGDFELVVVDDGSTDGGADVVRAFGDSRIRLVHRQHVNSAGGHAARNRGIEEARSDLIALLDADDEWSPEHLATILRLAADHPECGAYATAVELVDAQQRHRILPYQGVPRSPWEGVIPNYFQSALETEPVCSSTAAVWGRVFRAVGVFPVGERRGGDRQMWFRIALKYPVAFSWAGFAIVHNDAQNRISSRPGVRSLDHPLIRESRNALANGSLPTGVVPNDLREYTNAKLIESAIEYLTAGRTTEARERLKEAASTRRLRGRWAKWRLLSLVPYPMLKAMLGMKTPVPGPGRSVS